MRKLLENSIIQISLILFVVFSVQVFSNFSSDYFVLSTPLESYPLTIVSSVYSHGSFSHLFSNLVGLVVFGLPVARLTSNFRFHSFFVLIGGFSGVVQVLSLYYLDEFGFLALEVVPGVLGSSGAVFGFFGYFLASNKVTGFFAKYLPVPDWLKYFLYVSVAVFVTLATASPGVALIAHFTGFLIGLILGRRNVLKL